MHPRHGHRHVLLAGSTAMASMQVQSQQLRQPANGHTRHVWQRGRTGAMPVNHATRTCLVAAAHASYTLQGGRKKSQREGRHGSEGGWLSVAGSGEAGEARAEQSAGGTLSTTRGLSGRGRGGERKQERGIAGSRLRCSGQAGTRPARVRLQCPLGRGRRGCRCRSRAHAEPAQLAQRARRAQRGAARSARVRLAAHRAHRKLAGCDRVARHVLLDRHRVGLCRRGDGGGGNE